MVCLCVRVCICLFLLLFLNKFRTRRRRYVLLGAPLRSASKYLSLESRGRPVMSAQLFVHRCTPAVLRKVNEYIR